MHHFNAHLLLYYYYYFANDKTLLVYFIFILDCTNDVRQKANLSDHFIQVQNGL